MTSEYIIEDTHYNVLRALGVMLGAVVIVAALGIALVQKLRPW